MKFFLIDGSAICYRAFYANAGRPLQNSKGFPTQVPFGFVLCLKKIRDQFKPDGIAVAFDLEGPTFRHERFDQYKAHRKPTPEDLIAQIPWAKRLIRGYGIPLIEKQGYEADDVMGTAATFLRARGHEVYLVTSDKDACQLVGGGVYLVDPGKDYTVIGPAEVYERLGVKPEQVVDFLALCGDASDNIPGLPGVGPKTAVEWIGRYGSMDNLYKHVSEIPSEAKRRLLTEHREDALLSRELATIDCLAPVETDLERWRTPEPDYAELKEIFKELEFRSLLKDLPGDPAPAASRKHHLVSDAQEWKALLKKVSAVDTLSLDFETTGTDPLRAEPVGLSLTFLPGEAWFILFDLHHSGKSSLKAAGVLKDLKPILENTRVHKVGQNIKYEMMLLRRFGVELKGVSCDTMVASYLLNPSKPNHNLGDIAFEYLEEKLIPIEELIGTGKKQITMADADLDTLCRYGCQDSDTAFRLSQALSPKIEACGMTDLFREIEIPLIEVLCDLESAGIEVDAPFFNKLSREMEKEMDRISAEVFKLAKKEFNLNSTRQLGEILFEDLKLPVVRKTKTGYSTDMEVLTQLADLHELPRWIIQYRELAKLKSTYADTLPEMINPQTGRVHSSFNQTVTATGRLSSSDPNMQNIPIRTEEGRRIRRGFVAGKGNAFLSADYSQIELRVLAHLSGDPALQKAFRDKEDIHAYTAGLIFSVPVKEVTSTMRNEAKTVNFGVLYGMGPFGLARSLKISQDAARDFIQSYFERYPKVKGYLEETIEKAKQTGFVETLFKRRRYIPDIRSSDVRLRQFAERTAINAPVQGTASDLIKIAMVAIHRKLKTEKLAGRLVVQVHDELVFETPQKELRDLARLVKREMEDAVRMDVPIEATLKTGPNWLEMEKFAV